MKGDDEKCISAGCDHYLPKPIKQERLLEIIARYLPAQSQSLSEEIESINSQVDEPGGPCVGSVQGHAQRPEGALGQGEDDGQADETSIGDTYASVIDWTGLRGRVADEREIEKVIAVFLGENAKLVGILAGAVRAAKTSQVRVYASALRGSAANIGAKRLSDATHRLEVMARKKDLSIAESLLQEITTEFERLQSFVSKPNWMEIAKQHSCSRQS
jgi:HPt (histidine-containing phosphotransfer) domain-containing protein